MMIHIKKLFQAIFDHFTSCQSSISKFCVILLGLFRFFHSILNLSSFFPNFTMNHNAPAVYRPKYPKRQNSDAFALEKRGYKFGKRIGKGSYGNVVTARYDDRGSGDTLELACKYVDKKKAPKDFLIKFLPREIEILSKISHPNIIGIHSILQSGSTVFIFMQWAANGDLLEYVKRKGPVPEPQANLWFFQMTSAIKYIHDMNYAHRDLKCENILISKHMNIKIADFGFARKCVDEREKKILSETFCGSAGKNKVIRREGIFVNNGT